MRQYKIEIFCAEDFADKGIEVLDYIEEMLNKKYGDDEYIIFGSYVRDEEDENANTRTT